MREIRTALIAWGLYIASQAGYCLIHTKVVDAFAFTPRAVLIWAVSELGIWLLITPFVFRALRLSGNEPYKGILSFIPTAAGALVISLSLRVTVDLYTGTRDAVLSVVIFLPRYAGALLVIVCIWYLLLRPKQPAVAHPAFAAGGDDEHPHDTLLVNKGNDKCLIRVQNIQYASAIGNYVEIACNDRLYLVRATIKQLETRLPESIFLRIHRSHIVNVNEIEGIEKRPSGNAVARLRGGKALNISRRFKSRLPPVHPQSSSRRYRPGDR